MKVKQFPLPTENDDPLMSESEKELNDFLKGIQFSDVHYSGVSGRNVIGQLYVTGMVLVKYEDGTPESEDIVQMKQFPLATRDSLRESTHEALNDFIASVDVKDMKYAGVSGRNECGEDFVTGLVLVAHSPSQK